MALKKKGNERLTPKSGPKKRRAKADAELIQKAVEEHGARGVKTGRRATRVRKYAYKAPTANPQRQQPTVEMGNLIREADDFELFRRSLDADEEPFANVLYQMECEHPVEGVTTKTSSFTEGADPVHVKCLRCGLVRNWHSSKKQMSQYEWSNFCPEGFDMWDWQELYSKDKSLWRFIFTEAEASLVDESLQREEAA